MTAELSNFTKKLMEAARLYQKLVALPESTDPRVLKAAQLLLETGSCRKLCLFGNESRLLEIAKQNGITLEPHLKKIDFADADPTLQLRTRQHAEAKALSKNKPLPQVELDSIASSPIERAALLLAEGKVDAAVAGCVATTAEVIRAALRSIGLSPGNKTISGSFAMVREIKQERLRYMFADCGVVIDPNPEQLVDIAAATVATHRALYTDQESVVAFLSFSTKGSAEHPKVDKVRRASALFKERYPHILSDGEFQFDAAFSSSIGSRKAPNSPVPGQANCFIFPDLDSGNIAYKITQRLGGFEAYGPILQGTAKPFNDLSRGASAEDIFVSSLIAMLRANQ